MKKLFLLKSEHGGLDSVVEFVVRAEGKRVARKLASAQAGDEGSAVWLSPRKSTCEVVEEDGVSEVVVRHFRPG